MCDGFGRNFSIVARIQAPTVRKADAREMRGCPGRDVYTVQRPMRCLSSTAPGQEPPPLTSFVSLWARRPNQPLRRSNRGKLESDSTHYRPVTCCRHTLL
jgi:hypothetical protein